MKQGKLVIISGPGGSGKNTILNLLLNKNPSFGHIVTATTHPIRIGEVEGRDHYFLSSQEFQAKISQRELVEYTKSRGYLFGTLKKPLEEALESGVTGVMEITVDGGLSIKQLYPNQTTLIFINLDKRELEARMRLRDIDSEAAIRRRLAEADKEIELGKSRYDHIVENPTGHPEEAVLQIEKILTN